MLKRSLSAVVPVALLTVMVAFPAWAVPGLINYQGEVDRFRWECFKRNVFYDLSSLQCKQRWEFSLE